MSQGCCNGGVLPSDDGVNNFIAGLDRSYPPGGGQIAYETRDSVPIGPSGTIVEAYTP